MPLTQLAHFLIFANDLEASKDFYVDVLGLQVGARPPFPFPGYWLYLGDTACVHMASAAGNAGQNEYLGEQRIAGENTGAVDHIAFNATDLVAFVERAESRGIELLHRIVPEDGSYQVFFRDPNGIKIELTFAGAEAEQLSGH